LSPSILYATLKPDWIPRSARCCVALAALPPIRAPEVPVTVTTWRRADVMSTG